MLGEIVQVCSKFFLGTLGYKKDNIISTLFNKQIPNKSRLSDLISLTYMESMHQLIK